MQNKITFKQLLLFPYQLFNKLAWQRLITSEDVGAFLFKKYYIFFLCVNIFLPKISIGGASFYVFEFLNIALFGVLILRGKLFLNSIIVITYVLFILLTLFSYLVGVLNFNFFDVHSLFRLLKFTLFIFYIIAPFYICKHISDHDLWKVLNFQILFFAAAGSYVLFNYMAYPGSLME